jgi:hypothetical protein
MLFADLGYLRLPEEKIPSLRGASFRLPLMARDVTWRALGRAVRTPSVIAGAGRLLGDSTISIWGTIDLLR